MKKCLLGFRILSLVGLFGCLNRDSPEVVIDKVTEEVVEEEPFVRVVFNPAGGDINITNDFLWYPVDFFDFTLNTEGDEAFDAGNPQHTLSALDG